MTEEQQEPQGDEPVQPSPDTSVYHDVEAGVVGQPTEEPRPDPTIKPPAAEELEERKAADEESLKRREEARSKGSDEE